MKHVKENDLAHGEWSKWLETINMTQDLARRFVRVFEEFGDSKHVTSRGLGINALGGSNYTTSGNLGVEALYQIATLPPEHITAKGDVKREYAFKYYNYVTNEV